MRRLLLLILGIILVGCDSGPDEADSVVATTILTSSTLGPQIAAPKQAGTDFPITPGNVSGQALSVLFPIHPAPDDGIVVFGEGRPDIAPSTATLYPFDFGAALPISATIQVKPGLSDGTVDRVNVLLGYADFEYVQLDGVSRTLRVALGSVDGMTRGDKLLETSAGFQWFDLDSESFTGSRPANPAVIEEIRDFTDPTRPNLVFYPLVVELSGAPIQVVAADFLSASRVDAAINFQMLGAITLEGHNTSSLTEEEAIQAFTLTQISGTSTGLGATASLQANP